MRKILAALLAAALLACMVGCKPFEEKNLHLTQGGCYTDFPGVEIRVAQVYTGEDKTKLEVIWSNHTSYEVVYGEPYAIQRLDGNEWVSCSKNALTAFFTVGYALKAGKEISKTYTISELFDVSQPGTYRFKSSCSVYAEGNTSQDCTLWAEFTIGQADKPEYSAGAVPPEANLSFSGGERTLPAAGYQWTYESSDGTVCAVIADQAGRPLEQRFTETIVIDSGHDLLVKLDWETAPTSVTCTCWPDTVWKNSRTPEDAVVSPAGFVFYAKPGGYVYEIAAQWEDTGAGYYGTANYYVYIIGRNEVVP